MKWLYSGYAVVLSIVLLLALRVVDPTPLQSLRGQVFDSYQQLDEIVQSEDVVLLNFGENTLATYGQYPFPRQYYAQLIVDVATKNSGVVGWTIMFPEEDRLTVVQRPFSDLSKILDELNLIECVIGIVIDLGLRTLE